MNPSKVNRNQIANLTDLPNIGKTIAATLALIEIEKPEQLIGRDPYEMYDELSAVTGKRYDPCLLDVFISIVDFINGGEPKPWWTYTKQRKNKLAMSHN